MYFSIEGFKNNLISMCNKYDVDGVIPSGTLITNSLSMIKRDLENATNAVALVEDYSKLNLLSDKWNLYNIAIKLGIPAPRTLLLSQGPSCLKKVESLKFPCVVKPRNASASKGVHFFPDSKTFAKWQNREVLNGQYIIQEKIEGALHDVTSCAQKGRPISLLSQRRLKTFYDFGGGGIVNVTTYEPKIMEYARAILKFMQWNGVAEFDFIRTDDNRYFLIECNPKIWGTTMLTVLAGMNVPQQVVDVFLGAEELSAVEEYYVGLLYRWWFPECLMSLIQPPINFRNFIRRMSQIFHKDDARKVVSNLRSLSDILHLVGSVLNTSRRRKENT